MILWRKVFRLRLDEIGERVWLEARHIFQVNVLGRRGPSLADCRVAHDR